MTDPETTHADQLTRIRELADKLGCIVRLEHDREDHEAPMQWALWVDGGAQGEDIAGAGDTVEVALDEAERRLREWVAYDAFGSPFDMRKELG